MTPAFDAYQDSYGDVVQSSIDFSGLPHAFFLEAKAALLQREIIARFGSAKKLAALDAGCGIGALHPYVRNLFEPLCGVDLSAACIAQARAANPDVDYKSYDGSSIPYDDGAFDLVTAVCVLHHVAPAQWQTFIGELKRVTRRGGLVCVIEHNPLNPLTRLAVKRCSFDHDAVLLRSRRTETLMRDAGLQSIASQYFLLMPFAGAFAKSVEHGFRRIPLGAQYMSCGAV